MSYDFRSLADRYQKQSSHTTLNEQRPLLKIQTSEDGCKNDGSFALSPVGY